MNLIIVKKGLIKINKLELFRYNRLFLRKKYQEKKYF